MKKLYLLLLIIAVASTSVVSYKQSKDFQRKKYETLMKNSVSGIDLTGTEKKGEKSADNPQMASIQDFFMTADPATGNIPRERLLDLYQQLKMSSTLKTSASDIMWTNIPVEMGGRTRAIMYDPNEPDKVWAGGVTGGLWYNNDITDPNMSWIPVGDFWSCLAIRCITYDPNNNNIFYLGTGEPETALQTYRESSGLGNGIWKSTDGGQTWNPLSSTSTFAYVPKIVVRNEGGNSVIYAGVVSGLYHGIHNSQPSDGLFRSTDGGSTWTQVLPNINGFNVPYSPADIALGADNRIYIGSMPNLLSQGGATILYSDSGLPGSWVVNDSYKSIIESNPNYPIPGRVVLTTSASDPNRVYALVSQGFVNPVNGFKYFYCFHIAKSTNKGVSFTDTNLPNNLTSGISFATIAWHALDVVVDPNNADVVWVGGLDVHKSTNGGNSWNRVSDWALMYYGGGPQYIHADQHIMVYKPGSSLELLMGTDGGVFYTPLATGTPAFEQRNKDYNTLQFYTADIKNDINEDVLMGGLQDNGTEFYNGTPMSINTMISGGDGAFAFFDRDEQDLWMSSHYYNVWYMFENGININYVDSWESGVFVNPTDYDYKNNILYANSCDFTGTRLDQYSKISGVPWSISGEFIQANTSASSYFSSVKLSPFSPTGKATLFLGTQSGQLYKVVNAESIPLATEITGSSFPVGNISSIDIGTSENEILVTFSNYGVVSVWHTNDGGIIWKNKEADLPDMPVRWGIFHPQNKKQVMLATEAGIWSCINFDQDIPYWTQTISGMANVRVDMLNYRTDDLKVVAATHGRGLFTAIWDNMTGTGKIISTGFSVYPNPTTDLFSITYNVSGNHKMLFSIFNQEGKTVYTREKNVAAGNHEEHFNIKDYSTGVYYICMYTNGTLAGSQKLVRVN